MNEPCVSDGDFEPVKRAEARSSKMTRLVRNRHQKRTVGFKKWGHQTTLKPREGAHCLDTTPLLRRLYAALNALLNTAIEINTSNTYALVCAPQNTSCGRCAGYFVLVIVTNTNDNTLQTKHRPTASKPRQRL